MEEKHTKLSPSACERLLALMIFLWQQQLQLAFPGTVPFIFRHQPTCSACCSLSTLTSDSLLLLHNAVPLSQPPLSQGRSFFSLTSDPWPLPLVQEMTNMPQKGGGSMCLAYCQLATPPSPGHSLRRYFPHDSDPARDLHALEYRSDLPCKKKKNSTAF